MTESLTVIQPADIQPDVGTLAILPPESSTFSASIVTKKYNFLREREMSTTFGPIVVHQYTNALDAELIETHTFPDMDAFQAWAESQETTVFLEFEPMEEVIVPESPTFQGLLDFCPWCGIRILDFDWAGYEDESGQRGHTKCRADAADRMETEK